METQSLPCDKTTVSDHSGVDTSRPFRSVKEAVAIYDERFLAGDIHSQKSCINLRQEKTPKPVFQLPSMPSSLSHSNQANGDEVAVTKSSKKLETELEKKRDLKESESEIALASLNTALHKNVSKTTETKVAATGKTVSASALVVGEYGDDGITKEAERTRDPVVRIENSPSLAQILSFVDEEGYYGVTKKQRKMMKKKPIIPLVGDLLFSRKKGSTTLHNPLYNSSQV